MAAGRINLASFFDDPARVPTEGEYVLFRVILHAGASRTVRAGQPTFGSAGYQALSSGELVEMSALFRLVYFCSHDGSPSSLAPGSTPELSVAQARESIYNEIRTRHEQALQRPRASTADQRLESERANELRADTRGRAHPGGRGAHGVAGRSVRFEGMSSLALAGNAFARAKWMTARQVARYQL